MRGTAGRGTGRPGLSAAWSEATAGSVGRPGSARRGLRSRRVAVQRRRGRCCRRSGSVTARRGPGAGRHAARRAVPVPTGVPFANEWHDVDMSVVRLPVAVVERVAEERLGVPEADVRFDGSSPVSEPMRRTWPGLMRFVHQRMADAASGMSHPLVAAQLAELMRRPRWRRSRTPR
ncbi:hypothetical protein ACI798_11555 [Geodermatophilus sp. SYSU D01045]